MRVFFGLILTCFVFTGSSQTTTVEGYVFETGNRGYIYDAAITAEHMETEELVDKTRSDKDGYFKLKVPSNSMIRLYAAKEMFDIKRVETKVGSGKTFIKLEMGRAPGYTFEVTLAEKRSYSEQVVDAISGARIEVYNNTTRNSVMDLKDHDIPEFQLNLLKGNHYTILVRKNGFLSKRMEAKVDVEGCILCFEGVGDVGPGVSDNLTEGNTFGVLLANVELERIFEGKTMEIQNLYYDLAKWSLKGAAKRELNKVITLMKDNPSLTLELGAHTDSRGSNTINLELSNKRAQSAVNYLIRKGGIAKTRIVSKGYGENVLLNNCGNGSKCTEEEHAKNRRTELKIIGITDVREVKSLAQMKEEEFLEEQILELMDQEQIQAKDEEELSRILEADQQVRVDVPQPMGDNEDINSIDSVSQVLLLEASENEMKSKSVSAVQEKDQEEILETKEEEEEEEEESDTTQKKVSPITNNVSDGVKVILYQSPTPLSEDHWLFHRHEGLEVMDDGFGKIYYMIGGFRHESDAFQFRKAYILPDKKYKRSFVAFIQNGVLAVVNR
ncbi:MAG: OmpA family protein [Bacteroidota bacterium]